VNPTLRQPSGHGLQFNGGATKSSHWLAVAARRYSYIVGFVANINARGIGMYHLQTERFALDFPNRLPPLLAIHLSPCALHWAAFGFHANLPR